MQMDYGEITDELVLSLFKQNFKAVLLVCDNEDGELSKFYSVDAGGEYDMIIYDKSTNTCKLYEIKHSDKIDDRQIRFLVDKDKCELIENKYGTIVGKYVLYRGQNKKIESIDYINVEVFLTNLKNI